MAGDRAKRQTRNKEPDYGAPKKKAKIVPSGRGGRKAAAEGGRRKTRRHSPGEELVEEEDAAVAAGEIEEEAQQESTQSAVEGSETNSDAAQVSASIGGRRAAATEPQADTAASNALDAPEDETVIPASAPADVTIPPQNNPSKDPPNIPSEITDAWKDLLSQPLPLADLLPLETWYKAMLTYVSQGGPPFSPDQTPLPPSAPPHPSTPENLSLKASTLGFDPTKKFAAEGESEDLAGNWNFMHTLGTGNFGHASLWLQYSPSGTISNKIAIKETYIGPLDWDANQLYWDGPIARRVPNEASMGIKVGGLKDAVNVVRCLGWALHEELWMVRVYMEFCEGGDLEGVMGRYVDVREKGWVDRDGVGLNYRVPTHLLWCIFEALASVACLMASGTLPGLEKPERNRRPDCHFDIKPRNVFLSPPGSHGLPSWPDLPVPKLGDWGTAMNEEQTQWRTHARVIGTPGYKPPEKYDDHPPYSTRSVGPHSDIWSIGRTMASLMNLDRDDEDLNEINRTPPTEATVPRIHEEASEYYPPRMVQLVQDCLLTQTTKRPKPEGLWKSIQEEVATYRGLSGMPVKQTKIAPGEIMRWKPDVYALFAQ